jgi:hypothetical protein
MLGIITSFATRNRIINRVSKIVVSSVNAIVRKPRLLIFRIFVRRCLYIYALEIITFQVNLIRETEKINGQSQNIASQVAA